MRAWILPVVFVLLVATVPSFAQEEKSEMDLMAYPGSETMMEVNLSAEDILPMLQATLPMMTGGNPGLAKLLKPEDLSEILNDLKRIEFLQLDLKKPKVTLQQVVDYYTKNLPNGKWSRVYYSSSPSATLAVYADPQLESYYGFRVRTTSIDGRQTKQIDVAKLVGKIDFARLLSLAAKMFLGGPVVVAPASP